MKQCKIEGCEKPILARGWCSMHYARCRRHGDTSIVLPKFEVGLLRAEYCIHGHNDWYSRLTGPREGRRECRTCSKTKHRHLRMEVLLAYGDKCSCPGCEEWRYEFLGIDHIDGGGSRHRKSVLNGTNFYRWLRNNNLPEGFRVLCHNCNLARGFYGYCPHGEEV